MIPGGRADPIRPVKGSDFPDVEANQSPDLVVREPTLQNHIPQGPLRDVEHSRKGLDRNKFSKWVGVIHLFFPQKGIGAWVLTIAIRTHTRQTSTPPPGPRSPDLPRLGGARVGVVRGPTVRT